MTSDSLKLEAAIEALNQIGPALLVSKNKTDALQRIVELAQKALCVDACTLVLIDPQQQEGYQVINCIEEKPLEQTARPMQLEFAMEQAFGTEGLASASPLNPTHKSSSDNGKGAHQGVGRTFSLRLKSQSELLGHLHFDFPCRELLPHQKRLCEIFANYAVGAIRSFDQNRKQDLSLRFLSGLSRDILSTSSTNFLKRVSNRVRQLLEVPVCIIWLLNPDDQRFSIVATSGKVRKEYRSITLGTDYPNVQSFASCRKVAFALDVTRNNPKFLHLSEAQAHCWTSLLSAPMRSGDRLIGILDVYTTTVRKFTESEKELFGAFANYVALYLQKANRLREILAFAEKKKRSQADRVIADIQRAVDLDARIGTAIENDGLDQTLDLIARHCAMATKASLCSISFCDSNTGRSELKALYTSPTLLPQGFPQIEEQIVARVVQKQEAYLCPDTSKDMEVGDAWAGAGFVSALSVPVKSGGVVIGTVSVGSDRKNRFGLDEQRLLEKIVDNVATSIEKANIMKCLLRFKEAAAASESMDELLGQLVTIARDLMQESVCIILVLDKDRNGFVGKARAGSPAVDNLNELFISLDAPPIKGFLSRGKVLYLPDASAEANHPYYSVVRKLNWKSMLAAPLSFKGKLIGVLEIYSLRHRRFTNWHQQQLRVLADQASIAINHIISHKMMEGYKEIVREIEQSYDEQGLWTLLLDRCLKIVGSSRGWVGRWDAKTGQVKLTACAGPPINDAHPVASRNVHQSGLLNGESVRIKDTRHVDSLQSYKPTWEDTRSVLAVPLYIDRAEIRVGSATDNAPKMIGIINIESPTADAFSHDDAESIRSLCEHAAIKHDERGFELKLESLRELVKHSSEVRDWDERAKTVARGIIEMLGADYVVMSSTASDLSDIERIYPVGVAGDHENGNLAGQQATDHEEIAALVIKQGNSQVIGAQHDASHPASHDAADASALTRVFVPIPGSSGNPIGVVEAGYMAGRGFRVYERDINILQRFVDHVAKALELRRMGLLETISHDLTAPIVAIRNDTDYLEHRIGTLSEARIRQKLNYISIDCEILLSHVQELEYILGLSKLVVRKERTDIVRNVIIKTLEQIRAFVASDNTLPQQIYFTNDADRIIELYLDQARLNQVVNNLLKNAVKYAAPDPQMFRIEIRLQETAEDYTLSFKDWGMGIDERYSQQVFNEGFRAPEAIRSFTPGRGLGLAIARRTVRELGGDLTLVNYQQPTEFRLTLPKSLREAPVDSLSR
jgi:GAF domain-containing protein/signal transduction histidine kinase